VNVTTAGTSLFSLPPHTFKAIYKVLSKSNYNYEIPPKGGGGEDE